MAEERASRKRKKLKLNVKEVENFSYLLRFKDKVLGLAIRDLVNKTYANGITDFIVSEECFLPMLLLCRFLTREIFFILTFGVLHSSSLLTKLPVCCFLLLLCTLCCT